MQIKSCHFPKVLQKHSINHHYGIESSTHKLNNNLINFMVPLHREIHTCLIFYIQGQVARNSWCPSINCRVRNLEPQDTVPLPKLTQGPSLAITQFLPLFLAISHLVLEVTLRILEAPYNLSWFPLPLRSIKLHNAETWKWAQWNGEVNCKPAVGLKSCGIKGSTLQRCAHAQLQNLWLHHLTRLCRYVMGRWSWIIQVDPLQDIPRGNREMCGVSERMSNGRRSKSGTKAG